MMSAVSVQRVAECVRCVCEEAHALTQPLHKKPHADKLIQEFLIIAFIIDYILTFNFNYHFYYYFSA